MRINSKKVALSLHTNNIFFLTIILFIFFIYYIKNVNIN